MTPYLELRLDARKKTSSSARAGKKLKCTIEQCGGRCLRAGEVCRLTPTKEQGKIWGRAKKAVKPVKEKATPAQKAQILSQLGPDGIEDLGLEFKQPPAPTPEPKPVTPKSNAPKLENYKTVGGAKDAKKIAQLTKTWDTARGLPGVYASWITETVASKAKVDPDSFRGVVDSKGNLQAGMILGKGKDSIEVDYLATAPWNRPGFPGEGRASRYQKKAVKGAGTAAIVEAVKESQLSGLNGKVTLYALGEAIPFYEKLGFEHKNKEEMELRGNSTMFLSPEKASELVDSHEKSKPKKQQSNASTKAKRN